MADFLGWHNVRSVKRSNLANLQHVIFGFGERNANEERLLEVCNATPMVVANVWFKREWNNLASYLAGVIKNTALRRCDRIAMHNVKVIASECAPQQ